MVDVFNHTAPLGWLGKMADWFFKLQRNTIIKAFAESDRCKQS